MYSLLLSKHFISSAKKLEKKTKIDLNKSLKILEHNPSHPHLHLKPLHGPLRGFYSFRIGKYRVIIQFLNSNKIRVLEIEKRDKVYK